MCVYICTCINVYIYTHTRTDIHTRIEFRHGGCQDCMGWLRLVGSFKLQVSFAKEPYKRDDILQKRPIYFKEPNSRSHLISYMFMNMYFSEYLCINVYIYALYILICVWKVCMCVCVCVYIYTYVYACVYVYTYIDMYIHIYIYIRFFF